jgi:hypothetical protein
MLPELRRHDILTETASPKLSGLRNAGALGERAIHGRSEFVSTVFTSSPIRNLLTFLSCMRVFCNKSKADTFSAGAWLRQ